MSSFSIALRRPLVESRPSSSSRRGSRARQPGRLLGARRLTVEPLEDRRLLSAGDLDPTFGVGGKVVTDIGFCTPDAAYDVTVLVQAGDKLLVAGNTQRDVTGYDFLLLRYNADGILDPTFGTGGMVFTDFGSQSDYAYALTVQSDGKIVVAGYSSQSGTDDFALARYLPDGTLDTSFSGDGKLTTAFGTSTDRAYDVAVQSDGKIVAVGYSIQSGSGTDFAVARYDASGNLDGTFDGDGKATANFTISTDQAFGVAIQSDGKIVAAGSSYQPATGTDDFALVRYNANGSLDTSFDADGRVTTHFGRGADYGQDVVLQMVDGQERILVAGYAVQAGTGNDVALARYNPNGSLDTTFDGDGRVTTDFVPGSTYDDRAYSVALQSDGKIVASGVSTASGNANFAVVRYLSNGALDASFDSDGKVVTDFGSNDEAWGSAIQADGKIVAVGRSSQAGTSWDVALARYQTNGSLDTSFGYDGKVTTDVGRPGSDDRGWGMATALQGDGKIVVVGQTNSFNYDFAVARYNANGSPDASFGSGGSVVTDFDIPSSEDCARGVAIQTDGKIVAIGYIYRRITSYDFALARYNPDGALDATFGTDGKVTTDMGASSADQAYGVAIQADGKIVVVGRSERSTTYFDFAIARYNANGTLDTSFGTGGKVVTPFSTLSREDVAYDVAIQADGMIVAVGYSDQGGSKSNDFALARYTATGTLDTGFGSGGKVTTHFGYSFDYGRSVAIQPDGKIVVAGDAYQGSVNTSDFALARYNANGSLDTTFGTSGKVTTHFGYTADRAYSVALLGDGRIVAAGDAFQGTPNNYDFGLARYNSNGSLDTQFGVAGKVTTHFGNYDDYAYGGVALQADGKIVAAGYAYQGTTLKYDFALARYLNVLIPEAGGPYTGTEGSPMTFDASLSNDPGGRPLQYRWDFTNDGTWDTDWASSPTVSYTFADNFSGTVRVAVTNGTETATDTAAVTVLNVAPTAEAGGPYTVDEGSSIPLALAGSGTDPAGENDPLVFAWDFDGDGQFDDAIGANPTFDASLVDGPATVTVTLRVSDDDGGSRTDTATIVVNNLAPTADAGGPYAMTEGGALALAGSGSDPGSANDPLVFAWDFDGDGLFGETGAAAQRGDELGPNARFSAENVDGPSTVTVALRVIDRGGLFAESTAEIQVANVAPVITNVQVLPRQMEEGGWELLAVGFADPGSTDGHLVRIQWGDGTADTYWWLPYDIVRQAFYHYYADDPAGTAPDVYPIHVTVTDVDGAVAESGVFAIQERTVFNFVNDLYFDDAGVHYVDSLHAGAYTIWMPSGEDFQVLGGWHRQSPGTPMPSVGTAGETVMLARDDGQPFALKEVSLQPFELFPTQPIRLTFTGTRSDGSMLVQTIQLACSGSICLVGFTDVVSVSWQASTEAGYSPLFRFDNVVVETYTTETEDPEMGVLNVAPRITGLALDPIGAAENGTVTLAGTFVDPGTADTHRVLVDWGDGSPPTAIDLAQGDRSISAAHQYLDDGSYTVGVTVSDDDGGSDSSGRPVTVTRTVLDFAEWTYDSAHCEAYCVFQEYTNAGYSFDAPMGLRALGRFDPQYPGTTALFTNTLGPVVLTKNDGGPFTLESIDVTALGIMPRFVFAYVTFTGYRADGSTVVKSIATDGVFGFERIEFEGFTDLVSVTFQGDDQGDGWSCIYFFTNIVLEGRSNPIASPTVTVHNVAPVLTAYPGSYSLPENTTTGIWLGFQDPGLLDEHTVMIDWGDPNAPAPATFALPATTTINTGNVFASSTDDSTLTVTWVNQDFGTVEFLVSPHTYADDGPAPGNGTPVDVTNMVLTIRDDDGGEVVRAIEVTVTNAAPVLTAYPGSYSLPENTTTGIWLGFQDPGLLDEHMVMIDWGDPNAPAPATFALPATTTINTNDVFASSTDDSTLTVTWVNTQFGTVEFLVSPHTYADDGPAPGNGTPVDVTNMVVTIRDDDGGELVRAFEVSVSNVIPFLYAFPDSPWLTENAATGMWIGFQDVGLLDEHRVVIDWDDPTAPADSTFALPATRDLNEGDLFASSTDGATATIIFLNREYGFVAFVVSPHTYADDGPAPGNGTPADTSHGVVTIRDDDGGEAVAAFDVTVLNVDPVVTDVSSSATLDTPGAQGQPVEIGATFTDIGTLDVHEAVVDWGDGTPLQPATVSESGGSGSLSAAHVYAHGGVYQVTLTLTDDDTGIATAATTAAVVGAGVNQGVLQIVGTNGPDVVTVNATGTGLLDVHASFFADPSFRTFDLAAITRIEMWLCGGDDLGSIAGAVDLAAVLRGGSGNDHLNSGRAPSLLMGEDGNDTLLGSSGRDILIGGLGADRLLGQGEGDLLIAGTTAFDASDAALLALLDEWRSGRSFPERMDNIHNGTGPILDGTGWRLLAGITVFDDAESDDLTGCSGQDWFFFDPASDRVTDLKSTEGTN